MNGLKTRSKSNSSPPLVRPFVLLSVSFPLPTRARLMRPRQSRRAHGAGGREADPAHLDLTFRGLAQVFRFSPPHRINTRIDFDLRVVIFFSIWDYDESQDEVDARGEESRTENAEDKAERIKSERLTRSQSTFRKNGWPMMSAKPVWGWQPRRSLGSCGSKGESRVRDSVVVVGGMRRNVRERRERWRDLAGKVWWEWKSVRGE